MRSQALYTVIPVHVGTLTVDKSTLTFMRDFGQPTRVPIVLWVIRGGGDTYVVDTGAPPVPTTCAEHGPMEQTPQQDPAVALQAAGVSLANVRAVILTHLHFDHAANTHLFPSAEFLVQRRELVYARNPLPIHVRGYRHGVDMWERAPAGATWRVVDGDAQIAPGLDLLLTPGHTPGLQAVAVETAQGRVIIASDTVPLEENWRGEPPAHPHIPSAVHVDLREYYDSFARLERAGGRILPNHDFGVFSSIAAAP